MNSLNLSKGDVLLLRDLVVGQAIYGLAGMTWVTQEGDSRDHLLGPGGSFQVRNPGRVVVEALKPSRLIVTTIPRLRLLEAVKEVA